MDVVRQALAGDELISLPVLQNLGRQSLRTSIAGKSETLSPSEICQLWTRLQETACSTKVNDKHLRACCNTVCVFLNSTVQSENDEVRKLAFSRSTWSQSFDIVHKAFNEGKSKAAMQVLETLIQIIHGSPDPVTASEVLQQAVHQTVHVIMTGLPEVRLKESCITLSCFLHKTGKLVPFSEYFSGLDPQAITQYEQRCEDYQIGRTDFESEHEGMVTRLFLALLFTANVPGPHTAALKLFSYLCSLREDSNRLKYVKYANQAITVYLATNPHALTDFSTHVLPAVINSKEQFDAFLKPQNSISVGDVHSLSIFLAVLEVGRQKSFVNELDLALLLNQGLEHPSVSYESSQQDMGGFGTLLMCKEPGFRLQAFNLLTMSSLTNAMVPSRSFDCLVNHLRYIYDDSDAHYRDEFTSILRRFLERLGRSAAAAQRDQQSDGNLEENASTVARCRQFMNTYLNFLQSELSPNASYPRHILALQSLHFIFDADLAAILNSDTDTTMCNMIDPLLNLVMDPFEDVRGESTCILRYINKHVENVVIARMQEINVVRRAQKLSAVTNRSDHADALGRLHMLSAIASVENEVAKTDHSALQELEDIHLVRLVGSLEAHIDSVGRVSPIDPFPLHGTLLGIVYCIDVLDHRSSLTITRVKESVLHLCRTIWLLVQGELCVDTPERTTEDADLDDLAGPKDLLAYSWRALRDSSLLAQSLLKAPHQGSPVALYESIGDLCLEQLTRLRHRGAFSTVAQTYVLCCQKARNCDGVRNNPLLYQRWFTAAFKEIEDQAAKLTRRSAGLPAIFAALLDPNEPTSFESTIDQLTRIAMSKIDASEEGIQGFDIKLPQVHALNCLKDIMLNSRFRSVSEPMVVTMLNLAAHCLVSDVWAIRNCGLMLLRACINRLTPETSFSNSTGNEGVEIIGERTPLATALQLIDSTQDPIIEDPGSHTDSPSRSFEIVFAALDLLGRIPLQASDTDLVNDIYLAQLGSRLWSVREHSARLRASTVSSGDELVAVRALLVPSSGESTNRLHGKLLCSRYILQKIWASEHIKSDEMICEAIDTIQDFASEILIAISDPFILAAYLDILNDACCGTLANPVVRRNLKSCSDFALSVMDEAKGRAQFYSLQRSICLNRTYHYLWSALETGQKDFVQQDPSQDKDGSMLAGDLESSDVALYVLEELGRSKAVENLTSSQEFYFRIAIGDHCEDVRTAAMRNLAQRWQAYGIKTPSFSIQMLQQSLALYKPCGRDLLDAQVVLVAHTVKAAVDGADGQGATLTAQLISILQEALHDELEAPTRLNAVLSLRLLAPCLMNRDGRSSPLSEANQFRALCIMYDFLNDDDDEVRGEAVHAAHEILTRREIGVKLLPQCSVRARENLLFLLKAEFGHTTMFTVRVYGIVLGAQTYTTLAQTNDIIAYCQDTSVDLMLHTSTKRTNELFAEEKQNLYIDDVDEILAWSSSISKPLPELPPQATSALRDWVLTGLQRLATLMNPEARKEDNFGPLGPTYNEDILIVFIRCVAMSRLLLQSNTGDLSDKHSAKLLAISEHLAILRVQAVKHCAHHRILDVLNLDRTKTKK